MEQITRDVRADSGAEPREANGEAEHVHLLVNFPPTVAISRLVNTLKGVPSRRLRRHYWRANACGRGRTSLDRSAACPTSVRRPATTSSSRTGRPHRLTPGRLHHQPEDRRTGAHLGSPAPGAQVRFAWIAEYRVPACGLIRHLVR
jgi:putative transposase